MMARCPAAWLLPLSGLVVPLPALAQGSLIDLPRGPLGLAADALARQTGMSVVLADPALWERPVPAVRGRMTPEAAVHLLARHADAAVTRRGTSGWRLTIRKPRGAAAMLTRGRPVPPAVAATSADVVVLASKRGTATRSFAGSVEVIELPRVGIEAGTQALVTGSTIISSTYRGGGRDKLFVRGLADSGFSGRLQAVTGLYLGEVPLTYSAADPDLQLYDMASVEILQGPQGTLYGSGSLAGIIRFNPVMPKRGEAGGAIGGGVTTVAHGGLGADADAMVNLPVTGDLSIRAIGYARAEPGFIDKPAGRRDVNRRRIGGGRAIMRWWPHPGWTADAIVLYQTNRHRDPPYVTLDGSARDSRNPGREPFGGDYAAGHVVVTGEAGGATLVSASGVAHQNLREQFDLGSGNVIVVTRRHRLVTHETRLSRGGDAGASWTIGVSVTDNRSDSAVDYLNTPSVRDDGVQDRVSGMALFGEGTVRVGSMLALGAGLRGVQVVTVTDRRFKGLIGETPAFGARRGRQRWLLPSASAMLHPSTDVAIWLRYQQGRRPGLLPLPPDDPRPSGSDEWIEGIEAGLRWLPGNGAQVAASIQRSRWHDLQADLFEGLVGALNLTVGEATILSTNLRFDWPVRPGLSVNGAVTLNRTRAVDGGGGPRFSLPDAADRIVRGGVNWSWAIGHDASARLEGWARYEGTSSSALGSFTFGQQGDYLRTGVTGEVARGAWTLSLGIDNLLGATGTRYLFSAITPTMSDFTPLPPRTIRIAIRCNFRK